MKVVTKYSDSPPPYSHAVLGYYGGITVSPKYFLQHDDLIMQLVE